MKITHILAPSIFAYIVLVFVIGDLQGSFYAFFQPPDSFEYLKYNESILFTFNLIIAGDGNYFVTLPYIIPIFLGLDILPNYFAPIINFIVAYLVFRKTKFEKRSGLLIMIFFMGTILGISKEFWLFIGISMFILHKKNNAMFFSTVIARPQMLPVIIVWRFFLNKLTFNGVLVTSIAAVYVGYSFGAFRSQNNFLENVELQQSALSAIIDFLISYKFYTFPIGIFFSSIRLLLEMVASFFAGNMFGISVLFVSASFMLNFGKITSNKKIRPFLKLLIMLVVILSALPFPHSRYLVWLLAAIVVFHNFKNIDNARVYTSR